MTQQQARLLPGPDAVLQPELRDGTKPAVADLAEQRAGTNRLLATLHLPPQSQLLEARDGDKVVELRQGNELGLRWAEHLVTLAPGEARTIRLTFTERLGASPDVERISQPLVREERFIVTACSR